MNEIAEMIKELTPEQQAAVREFIEYLRSKTGTQTRSPFLDAVHEFIDEHPELLRRLAQ